MRELQQRALQATFRELLERLHDADREARWGSKRLKERVPAHDHSGAECDLLTSSGALGPPAEATPYPNLQRFAGRGRGRSETCRKTCRESKSNES